MNPSVFKFCQYVFLSYGESLDQVSQSENFDDKEAKLIKINTNAKVFDQELLANVLHYLKRIQSNVEKNSITQKDLATALLNHSKKLQDKN